MGQVSSTHKVGKLCTQQKDGGAKSYSGIPPPVQESAQECPSYFEKMKGAGEKPPPRKSLYHSSVSFLGSFTAVAVISLLHMFVAVPHDIVFIVGTFGSISVIVFSVWQVPLAQPYNVIVGNTIGGFVGVSVFKIMAVLELGHFIWLSAAIAVSVTIVGQELTRAVHPPGGSMALIFVTRPDIQSLGWLYVWMSSFFGSVIMVVIACVVNNLSGERTYPQYWSPFNAEPVEVRGIGPGNPIKQYLMKFLGVGAKAPPGASPPLSQTWCTFVGSFIGIAVLAQIVGPMMHEWRLFGAFGGMAILVFSVWKVPLAQPYNVIVGNTIGGFMGVMVYFFLEYVGLGGPAYLWLRAAMSVSLTVLGQEITNSLHPPGGAMALMFNINPWLPHFGYTYILTPSFLGSVILVVFGCLVNNILEKRAYPQWWNPF